MVAPCGLSVFVLVACAACDEPGGAGAKPTAHAGVDSSPYGYWDPTVEDSMQEPTDAAAPQAPDTGSRQRAWPPADVGAAHDAGSVTPVAPDTTTPDTMADSWSGVDTAQPNDIEAPPDVPQDAKPAVPMDTGPQCIPKTCADYPCGSPPDDCGGFLACEPCGPGEESCWKVDPPLFKGAVKAGVQFAKDNYPWYFDFDDNKGESVKILDAPGYHATVVAYVAATGAVAIVDPNDNMEIRVRWPQDDSAENYRIHVTDDYTAYKYTSTCAPAGF